MKKFFLYQHSSCENHGCEALIRTVSDEIKTSVENAEVFLCTENFEKDKKILSDASLGYVKTTEMLKKGTLDYYLFVLNKKTVNNGKIDSFLRTDRKCAAFSKKAELSIAIGGDNYCYNKGKVFWDTDKAVKKGSKKLMLWGCSIEPDELEGELINHLKVFDAITVRESITYEALKNTEIGDRCTLVSDPAFLLETIKLPLPDNFIENETVGINLSPLALKCSREGESILKSIYELSDFIINETNMNICFIPHVRIEGNDDADVLKPIYEHYKKTGRVSFLEDRNLGARELKGYISRCRFFVGARTHAVIAAYSSCVPSLCLGYSVKAKGLARDIFGSEDRLVLPVQTLNDPLLTVSGFKYIMENEADLKNRLIDIMPEYKEKAKISAEVLKRLIEG